VPIWPASRAIGWFDKHLPQAIHCTGRRCEAPTARDSDGYALYFLKVRRDRGSDAVSVSRIETESAAATGETPEMR
jgi:hypothetical protein